MPNDFKDTAELLERTVFIWQNRRGYLKSDEPWQTYSRSSIMELEPQNGFMEVWSLGNISDPPTHIDDKWIERYRVLEMKNYNMEWHPETGVLRLVWLQNTETLKEKKIISQIPIALESLNLEFPNFPSMEFADQ